MSEMAKVFEDRHYAGVWRVEWVNDDGDCEIALFAGPRARDRAILYANQQYGSFAQISLSSYPP